MNDLPRETLCEIIAKYGTSLCDEPLRCEGLLRDLCPANRREVNVLISALREHVAADLLSSSVAVPVELSIARLTKRLQEDQGLTEEMAHWAVESWALALRKISDNQISKSKPLIRQTPLEERSTEPQKSSASWSTTTQQATTQPVQRSTRKAKKNTILTLTLIAAVMVLGRLIYLVVRPTPQSIPVPTVVTTPSPSEIAVTPSSSSAASAAAITAPPNTIATQSPTEAAALPSPTITSPINSESPPASLISQDEVHTFINSFYHSLEQNELNGLLSYYDNSVDYFEYGRQDKSFIANDYGKYFRVSPVRSYSVGDIRLDNSPTQNTATASFDVQYSVENPAQHKLKTGRAREQWVLAKADGILRIIDIKETVYKDKGYQGEKYPEMRTRLISDQEAAAMSYAKLRYAINEVYARHGTDFDRQPEIRNQFRQFEWYHPRKGVSLSDIENEFSDIERANVNMLAKYRDHKK